MGMRRVRQILVNVTRWMARWTGALVALILFGVIVASAWAEVGVRWRDATDIPCGVTVRHGQLWIWRDQMLATPRLGWHVEWARPYGLDWRFEDWNLSTARLQARLVAIPIWWAAVLVGVPSMLAWGLPMRALPWRRRAARRAQGLCGRCGYDMAGIEGACPECGAS
jgi:hypothetical protein